MFSDITGLSPEQSEKIIIQTETGKAVLAANPSVLYEQQTENLACIASELAQTQQFSDLAPLLSIQNIVSAMKHLSGSDTCMKTAPHTISAAAGKKRPLQNHLLAKRNHLLQIKKQNQLNAGRMEYADKLKGQKAEASR